MNKIAFFDTKNYDKIWFNELNSDYEIIWLDSKLTEQTAVLADGCVGVIAFVNDVINKNVVEKLYNSGIKVIAIRCSGYNNIDFKAAYNKITILRVPAYSPHAVAEHTFAMLLALNRKIHKAYNRTRDFNFSLNGLCGIDLYGKTFGVIGAGKIGKIVCNIAVGFGMNVIVYDNSYSFDSCLQLVSLRELFKQSDIISLHCPLTPNTKHIINKEAIRIIKKGVYIINTSRGALINSKELLHGLKTGQIGGACLDVYEEESEWFFEDKSDFTMQDEVLSLLIAQPNVIVTSHQAFFTDEALKNIAIITLKNLDDYFSGKPLENEICYHCTDNPKEHCNKINGRCF